MSSTYGYATQLSEARNHPVTMQAEWMLRE